MDSLKEEKNLEESLYERALKVLPGGISRNIIFRQPHAHYVASAHGCYIEDVNGITRIYFVKIGRAHV